MVDARQLTPLLVVEALEPLDGRRTSITWREHDFTLSGDNHIAHGGSGTGPDGFDLLSAALGQCLLNTLLAHAQRDGASIRSAKAVVSTKARVRGAGAAPYLSDLRVDIYLDGDVDEPMRAELETAARTLCGVRETLRRSPRIEEHVHLGESP
jgi:uncharacterized OsmC-like protein